MKNNNQSINSVSGPPQMDWDHFSPVEIKVFNNFDKAFKLFRTLVQSERILSTFKQKQSYEKPSEKRRRKANESKRRMMENDIKMQKIKSGEYEKEKAKKLAKKEKKLKESQNKNVEQNDQGQ